VCEGRGPVFSYANSELPRWFRVERVSITEHNPDTSRRCASWSQARVLPEHYRAWPTSRLRRRKSDDCTGASNACAGRRGWRFRGLGGRRALIPVRGDPSEVALVFGVLSLTGSRVAGFYLGNCTGSGWPSHRNRSLEAPRPRGIKDGSRNQTAKLFGPKCGSFGGLPQLPSAYRMERSALGGQPWRYSGVGRRNLATRAWRSIAVAPSEKPATSQVAFLAHTRMNKRPNSGLRVIPPKRSLADEMDRLCPVPNKRKNSARKLRPWGSVQNALFGQCGSYLFDSTRKTAITLLRLL
jgi:hypothetical protein